MAKYYVQSGRVRLVLEAGNELGAAIRAFQWTCERQATIETTDVIEHVELAERLGWQLADSVWVSERGFNRLDSTVFDTLDVLEAWQARSPETEATLTSVEIAI